MCITMLEVDLTVSLDSFDHAVGVDEEFLCYQMYINTCIYVNGPSTCASLSDNVVIVLRS